MSYFADLYDAVKYPNQTPEKAGLRRAQLGAIHAVAAHFTRYTSTSPSEAAIVVMPTGSGKTAILMMSPFVLQVRRVLVVTPSRLVRQQIARKFEVLDDLIEQRVFGREVEKPNVLCLEHKLSSPEKWSGLADYDVVVTTPNCIGPVLQCVEDSAADLFDLLLIDEAHHEPAKTWRAILDAFPYAKKLLFTATPFRQDKKEIRGRIIYEFPVVEAYRDHIFGDLSFVEVFPQLDVSADISIALKTQQVFDQDKADGLDHYIMVRTNTKKHAQVLQELYSKYTHLNLRLIHSAQSARYIRQTVDKLQRKQLDGIICVDMLGEGFDFPALKLAAVHARHKSLPITLQFIGRFARTNASNIGVAKFIAIPDEIGEDVTQLYQRGAVWQELVPRSHQRRMTEEENLRTVIVSFESRRLQYPVGEKIEKVSLYSLQPFHHVKIYELQTGATWNYNVDIELEDLEIVRQEVSEDFSSLILISREERIPRWTDNPALARIEYDMFIVFVANDDRLLFINSSRKSETLYRSIASQIVIGNYRPLPVSQINKVLIDLEDAEFFNIGMRNRLLNSQTESYRIITGANAHNALNSSDGKLYHRGHVFGRGGPLGKKVTIGYSSASKVWSHTAPPLPGVYSFVQWCQELAGQIRDQQNVVTFSGLDVLPVGQELSSLPDDIYCVDWNPEVYRKTFRYRFSVTHPHSIKQSGLLLDLIMGIEWATYSSQCIRVKLGNSEFFVAVEYSPTGYPYFRASSDNASKLTILKGTNEFSILDFLNEYPLQFHTVSQSLLSGSEIFQGKASYDPFPVDEVIVVSWPEEQVDISREFGASPNENMISIHTFLERELSQTEDIVFYDHGTGEVADFITFRRDVDAVYITLFHVKAAHGGSTGKRVDDVYELCGQAVKSLIWCNREKLLTKMRRRSRDASSRFVTTNFNIEDLTRFLDETTQALLPARFQVAIVQPGISRRLLSSNIGNVLASARDFIVRGGGAERFFVIGSQ